MEIEVKLTELTTDLMAFMAKSADEQKTLGATTAETKASIEKVQQQLDNLEVRFAKPAAGPQQKSFEQTLNENEDVQRLCRDRKGRASITFKGMADFNRKAIITSGISTSGNDAATSGVLQIDRSPGLVPAARRRLFLGDLLTRIPTVFNAIDFVKVETDVTNASPQVEGSAKHENALTFATATANVRTIATWVRASKQILSDFAGLSSYIQASLEYAVKKEEERQLLAGDNTGENLNGLVTQATAFSTALLVAGDGWEYADMIGRAIQQLETADETEASFVALSPAIWWSIRLQKTTTGEYIYGNPAQGDGAFNLFGLTPIRTNAITAGTFLVGSALPSAAVIRDREELTVELSTEDADNFTKNMVSIRSEERIALVVFRPQSFVKGTFTQSPA